MSSRSYITNYVILYGINHLKAYIYNYRTLLIFRNQKSNRFVGQNMGGIKTCYPPHVKTWGNTRRVSRGGGKGLLEIEKKEKKCHQRKF